MVEEMVECGIMTVALLLDIYVREIKMFRNKRLKEIKHLH